MQEMLETVMATLRGAWRYRWSGLIAAWIVAALGFAVAILVPNSYQVKARVFVDTDSVLKPLLAGLAVGSEFSNDVMMMSTVLLSRPNLEKVARSTDLYLRAETAEDFDRLVTDLSRKISLRPGANGDRTYTIAYADRDKVMAQKVVQSLLNTFVEDTLGLKKADTTGAQRFLTDQIRDYELRLREAEGRLADFKKQNVGVMPGETGDYYTRLQAAMTSVDALRAKFRQLSERRIELARQLDGEEPTFGIIAPSATSGPNDAKIAELRARLDQLLVQFTDKHPEVVSIRENIDRLEQENKAGTAKATPGEVNASQLALRALDINPVYQNVKIALSQTDAELAELRGQISEQERQIGGLRGLVNTIPEVEAKLAQLNRDYEVNRTQYTALVQRLESARISQQAEQTTDPVKFRIIEPPVLPVLPAGPNRPLLLTLATFLAFGAGAGLALARSILTPVFSTKNMLKEATRLRVLGSVSILSTVQGRAWYQSEVARAAAAVGLLFVTYVVAVVATA